MSARNGTPTTEPGTVDGVGDLLAVAGFAVFAGVLLLAGVVSGPLRVLLAGVLLGLCPGYAVVSALYPVGSAIPDTGRHWIRVGHRAALAVATSLVVLVLAAIPLSMATFQTPTLVLTVVAITVGGCLVAGARRLNAPPGSRLRLPTDRLVAEARAATVENTRLDAVLNVALALAVVAGMATLAVGLAAPDRGANYSEVSLAGDDNASLVAGEPATQSLHIANDGPDERSYTVVMVLERFGNTGDGTESERVILERESLTRTTVTVAGNEMAAPDIEFTPSLRGTELRLSVYVYAGEAPETAAPSTADFHLYRWIGVESGTESLSAPTLETTSWTGMGMTVAGTGGD